MSCIYYIYSTSDCCLIRTHINRVGKSECAIGNQIVYESMYTIIIQHYKSDLVFKSLQNEMIGKAGTTPDPIRQIAASTLTYEVAAS